MKKNMPSLHKSQYNKTLQFSGLFLNRQSKQHILQEMKRGTLFQFSQKKQNQKCTKLHNQPLEQPKVWLYDIKLGIQNQSILTTAKTSEFNILKKAKLPNISKCKSRNYRIKPDRRCDKIACLTKKLAKIAAWNEENPQNINKNIEKLEKTLDLDASSLSQNDFWRVEGLNYAQQKSLESSLFQLDKSSILEEANQFNPFTKFPNFSDSIAQWQHKRKRKQKSWESQVGQQNHCIPQFLLTSLRYNSDKINVK